MTEKVKFESADGQSNHDRLLEFLPEGTLARRLAVAYGAAGTPEEKAAALATVIRERLDEVRGSLDPDQAQVG